MVARRQLFAAGAAGGAAALLLPGGTAHAGTEPPPPLDPTSIPKYVSPLRIPSVMPTLHGRGKGEFDEYRISTRQFRQQILPRGLPATTIWGYGSPAHPASFAAPTSTIEARVGRPVRVTWVNELVDRKGRYLPHLLPVDPTLHWANPAGGSDGRDSRPTFRETPGPYTGPVPMVAHLHGGHTSEESDGYPEAWFLPDARDIPAGYARVGSYYDEYREKFAHRHGVRWKPGSATYQYQNEQRATALWYHDHSHGLTRLGVYAGPIGYYFLRGGPTDLPAGVLPGWTPHRHGSKGGQQRGHQPPPHEIPLIIQDRSFLADGSLFYPRRAEPTDPQAGPFIPESDVPPIWIPGFHALTMMVNGRTWPVLHVEPRRYRLRLLNACNHRFLILRFAAHPTARPAPAALSMWQIGNDGGFLPRPVQHEQLYLANAERADVIVDFAGLPEGTELYLINEGPDDRFAGGRPGVDFYPANPDGAGQVMKFVVGRLTSQDTSVPPERLQLPVIRPLGPAQHVRRLSLNEIRSTIAPEADLVLARLGTVDEAGRGVPQAWHDPVSQNPRLGATEIWEFHNFSPHAHPIHLHQVQFEVIGRGRDGRQTPEPSEAGFKDVVMALPGHVTRVKARFSLPGRYVWHCHLLEHEDNDMMLPYVVGGSPRDAVDAGDGGSGYGIRPALGATGTGLLAVAAASGVLLARTG